MTIKSGFSGASLYSAWRGLKGRHSSPWFGAGDLDIKGAREVPKKPFPISPFSEEPEGTEKYLSRNQRRMF